jgi:hypothetical protein
MQPIPGIYGEGHMCALTLAHPPGQQFPGLPNTGKYCQNFLGHGGSEGRHVRDWQSLAVMAIL